jgi:hypothetical protein
MNFLGASWQPKVAAILTAVGPAGLFFLLTRYAHMSTDDATQISGLVFAILVAAGLATAKQSGVSNSPTPLAVAQNVVPVSSPAPQEAVPLAHPVPTTNTPAPPK